MAENRASLARSSRTQLTPVLHLWLRRQPRWDDAIVQGVYAWHASKARFTSEKIQNCIEWVRKHGFVPRGLRFETRERAQASEELYLGLDLFGRTDSGGR